MYNKMEDDLLDILEDISDINKTTSEKKFSKEDSKNLKKSVTFNDDDVLSDLLTENHSPKVNNSLTKNDKLTELFGYNKPSDLLNIPAIDGKIHEKPTKLDKDIQRQNLLKSIFPENDNTKKSSSSLENKEIKNTEPSQDSSYGLLRSTTDNTLNKNHHDTITATMGDIKNNVDYSPSNKRESRRSRRDSTTLDDPLGLFSKKKTDSQTKNYIQPEQENIVNTSNNAESARYHSLKLPEWLDGQGQSKEKVSEISSTQNSFENIETHTNKKDISNFNKLDETSMSTHAQKDQISMITDVNTPFSLLKYYEELANALENRKTELFEHKKQYYQILQNQTENQTHLNTQLSIQQQRINHCLQTLLAQSSFNPTFTAISNIQTSFHENPDTNIETEALVKQLRFEKLCLETTIESLKANHEKEIFILDESYRKQIQYLENTSTKLENRLIKDVETLEESFELKFQQMKDKMIDLEKSHYEEKEQMKNEHKKNLEEIYDRNHNNMKLLMRENKETLEKFAENKKLEQDLIDFVSTRGRDINKLLDNSKDVVNNLAELRNHIEKYDIQITKKSELFSDRKEKHIEDLKLCLQHESEVLEENRTKFIKMATNFQSDMSTMMTEFQSRMRQLIEMENDLKLRENMFVKEKNTFQKQLKQILENSSNKGHIKEDYEPAKVEVTDFENYRTSPIHDTSVNTVAWDNKTFKDIEASIIHKQKLWEDKITELQIQQNLLSEKENQLIQQAKQLEELTQISLAKKKEGVEAIKKANYIKQSYERKFQDLQVRLAVLEERENKIATENMLLARERIGLHMQDIELPEKDKNLMEFHDKHSLHQKHAIMDSQLQTHFRDIIDPKLIVLRMNLND